MKRLRTLSRSVLIGGLLLNPVPADAATVQDLLKALQRHGFTVKQQQPSDRNAYGQFIPGRKLLVIAPITRELGIARHVLLHEAVHAAQSCPAGRLQRIGLTPSADPAVERHIRYLLTNHYSQNHQLLEQEAFLIQSQPDAEALIIQALDQRC